MPLYDYRCTACQHVLEVRHGFNDAYEAPCAECGGALKRVFNPAPIVFKGSGFYVTDSRPSASGASSESASSASSTSAPSAPASTTPSATSSATPKSSESAA